MFEIVLIILLVNYFSLKKFKNTDYENLDGKAKDVYQKRYAKRPGKYAEMNENEYLAVVGRSAKISLIAFFVLLPVYIFFVAVYYRSLF
ncbi:MAG: hypothetical protein LBT30_04080 [Clostridiales bacterium]|jgi:propanediol utilization protein|nr:hypothetical protein [Clostridiales bacterium]